MMQKIKDFLQALRRQWYVKYVLVAVVGVAVVVFIDDNSFLAHLRNKQKIGELQEEIDHFRAIHQRDEASMRQLERDPKAVERVARERYYMKNDDEDIFVLRDSEEPAANTPADETVE